MGKVSWAIISSAIGILQFQHLPITFHNAVISFIIQINFHKIDKKQTTHKHFAVVLENVKERYKLLVLW